MCWTSVEVAHHRAVCSPLQPLRLTCTCAHLLTWFAGVCCKVKNPSTDYNHNDDDDDDDDNNNYNNYNNNNNHNNDDNNNNNDDNNNIIIIIIIIVITIDFNRGLLGLLEKNQNNNCKFWR